MSTLLTIILWILFGWITSHFAQQRGRDPIIWFFVGMFLGLIGLLLLFLLPTVTEESNKERTGTFDREETAMDPATEVEISPETVEVKPEYALHEWYYLDQERHQQGPIGFEDLKKYWKQKQITLLTYVWSQGMESWKKIEDLPELRNALC